MMERAFEFLFVVSLVAPPVAVLTGLILLGIPRRRTQHAVEPSAAIPAHV